MPVYPELPANTSDLLKLVEEHLAKRSRSFVADGHVFARVIKEKLLPEIARLSRQVTELQATGTKLITEKRRLQRFRKRVSKVRRRAPWEALTRSSGLFPCPTCGKPLITCPCPSDP